MSEVANILDMRMREAAKSFANLIEQISSDTFVHDGLVKSAVTQLVWELYERFPESRYSLAEILEGFDDVVREEADGSRETNSKRT